MPVTLTYPGVYVEELPSGVHAIVGVPTSVTAFVGRATRGPTDMPTIVNSFADYGRIFGGLALGYPMGYSVRDFFANGGGQAVIVRIWAAGAGSGGSSLSSVSSSSSSSSAFALPPQADGTARTNTTDPDTIGLALQASSPGNWGNAVTVQVATHAVDPTVVANLGYASGAQLFDLLVTDTGTGASETIRNVSVVAGTRRLDGVLPVESQLVSVPIDPMTKQPILPGTTPVAGNAINLSGGDDGGIITNSSAYFPTTGDKRGVMALENADIFNLLCIPPDSSAPDSTFWEAAGANALYEPVYSAALSYCKQRRAVLIADPPDDWETVTQATAGPSGLNLTAGGDYGAIYFPNLLESDPLRKGQIGAFAPSGAVAGVIATTDTNRGVWKAPAGTAAGLAGVAGLTVQMTDAENGELNPLGVNCLRRFPFVGNVVWGARTLRGADALTDDYKYLPVRRTALFIEESLFRGTKWVVFEPNAEPLWAQIRMDVGAFMQDLFQKGAFAGTTPATAYLVKCDSTTTTPFDQSTGVVNIVVGFAPLFPAEFVVLQIQQLAGQTA